MNFRFCLNCSQNQETPSKVCHSCGARRIAHHPELSHLSIAHLDCDAFYAAVEKRDDPNLADTPVIVGGGQRGVVTTACYVARTFGVRSAMPMFKALKACPNAVVIKPDFSKYVAASREIREKMRKLTPLVEPLSIDEAFLDLSGTERLHGMVPAKALAKLQQDILETVGITVSIGLSHNKFLAKIASDLDKPNGFSVIGKEETVDFLAKQPVSRIWGIGKVTEARLAKEGVTHISHLQAMDQSVLAKKYGELGLRLSYLAFGRDVRRVKPKSETKSLSSETTFNNDISAYKTLEDILWDQCEKISKRMKSSGLAGRVVTLKLKTNDFKSFTRRASLTQPSNLARTAFNTAASLLKAEADGRQFRLMGVGYSDLSVASDADQVELFASDEEKFTAQEKAIDAIREKFGDDAIKAGRVLREN